jgi:hypothetical protein
VTTDLILPLLKPLLQNEEEDDFEIVGTDQPDPEAPDDAPPKDEKRSAFFVSLSFPQLSLSLSPISLSLCLFPQSHSSKRKAIFDLIGFHSVKKSLQRIAREPFLKQILWKWMGLLRRKSNLILRHIFQSVFSVKIVDQNLAFPHPFSHQARRDYSALRGTLFIRLLFHLHVFSHARA